MSSDVNNVKRLIHAAWAGMEAEIAHKMTNGEEVINAGLGIAESCIQFACTTEGGIPPEDASTNRRVIQNRLQRMIMEYTIDEKKVM